MWLRVYVSKACFSLLVLPGAQAGMMQLQGKLRGASNPAACGSRLEQRQLQTLHPGPLIATALRFLPFTTCCPRFRCSACILPPAPSCRVHVRFSVGAFSTGGWLETHGRHTRQLKIAVKRIIRCSACGSLSPGLNGLFCLP